MEVIVIAGIVGASAYFLMRQQQKRRESFNERLRPKLKANKKLPSGLSDQEYISKVMADSNKKFQREQKIAQERAKSEKDFF